MFKMCIRDRLINLHGIGNGISLIIFASIVSRIPGSIISLFRLQGTNWFLIFVFVLIAIGTVVAIILIQEGERRIPEMCIRDRVIAGGPVRIIMELAGVTDVVAKIIGSSNALSVVNATVCGLKSLRSPDELKHVDNEDNK